MADEETETADDGEAERWEAIAVYGATSPEERRRALAILFFSLICNGAGQTVLFSILPPLSRQLNLSEFQVLLVFAVSAAIWMFSAGYWGRRSDIWGRKPVMLIGLVAFAVSTALFAATLQGGLSGWLPAAAVFPLMIASRSIFGLLGSGTAPASQAYIADRTTASERLGALATNSAAFGLGAALGPGVATMLTVFGVLAPFYFIAAMALASAVAIWLLLPEHSRPRAHAERPKSSLRWYDDRILPFVIFSIGLGTTGAIAIQTMSFFFMDVLGAKRDLAVEYTSIGQMASSMAALFAQLIVVQRFKFSASQLTSWGLILAFVSFVLFLVSPNFGPLIFALILSGLGFGIARPGFTAAASLTVSPHDQGAVAGIIGGASAAGFIMGPMIGLMYRHVSPYAPYAFGAFMMVVLFIYMRLSPVLRNAGIITPDIESVEQAEVSTPPGV